MQSVQTFYVQTFYHHLNADGDEIARRMFGLEMRLQPRLPVKLLLAPKLWTGVAQLVSVPDVLLVCMGSHGRRRGKNASALLATVVADDTGVLVGQVHSESQGVGEMFAASVVGTRVLLRRLFGPPVAVVAKARLFGESGRRRFWSVFLLLLM